MADNVLFYDPLLVNIETNKVSLEKEKSYTGYNDSLKTCSKGLPKLRESCFDIELIREQIFLMSVIEI